MFSNVELDWFNKHQETCSETSNNLFFWGGLDIFKYLNQLDQLVTFTYKFCQNFVQKCWFWAKLWHFWFSPTYKEIYRRKHRRVKQRTLKNSDFIFFGNIYFEMILLIIKPCRLQYCRNSVHINYIICVYTNIIHRAGTFYNCASCASEKLCRVNPINMH